MQPRDGRAMEDPVRRHAAITSETSDVSPQPRGSEVERVTRIELAFSAWEAENRGELPTRLVVAVDSTKSAVRRREAADEIGPTGTVPRVDLRADADRLLQHLTANPDAQFRDGQWEAIEALVERRGRALVVQRTGWGKSAVYFIATRLLRDQGAGPTVLISPLLALMRNQILMAERAGVRARTINSGNREEWDAIEEEIRANDRRPVADLAGASQQRALPRRDARRARAHGRPARGRRGALHQRLGSRLPPRLPPHRSHPRVAAAWRAVAVHDGDGQRPRRRRHPRAARRRPRDHPRHARSREPRPRSRRSPGAVAAPRVAGDGDPGVRRIGDRLLPHRGRHRTSRRLAAHLRHRCRVPTAAPPIPTCASSSKTPSWRTRSRCSSPPRRWAWGSTSPIWPSSSTTRARDRRSPTTSRSGAPAARSTTRPRSCSAVVKTVRSRTTSSTPRSRPSSRPRRSSGCSRRATRRCRWRASRWR